MKLFDAINMMIKEEKGLIINPDVWKKKYLCRYNGGFALCDGCSYEDYMRIDYKKFKSDNYQYIPVDNIGYNPCPFCGGKLRINYSFHDMYKCLECNADIIDLVNPFASLI